MKAPPTTTGRLQWRMLLMATVSFLNGCATPPREQLGVQPDAAPVYNHVAFSPDGRRVAATQTMANTVLVFDTITGTETLRFRPEELKGFALHFSFGSTRLIGPAAVAFTPDNLVAAASGDQHLERLPFELPGTIELPGGKHLHGLVAGRFARGL